MTRRVYTPSEKLPPGSNPVHQHIVLVYCNRSGHGKSWYRGRFLEILNEWRLEGENQPVDVERWMEIPK
jgi:hypothetical protein